jgi:dolichyl-phosphate-mannose-protein mannosyltransferase
MQQIYARGSSPPEVTARPLAGSAAGWAIYGILAAALVFRLLLLRLHGTQGDLSIFVRWAQWLMAVGTHGLYAHTDSVVRVPINYPPVYSLILTAIVWVYALPVFHGAQSDTLLRALLKIPGILADLGIVALAYTIVDRSYGRATALTAAAIAAFMPSTWPVSAIWGQIDSVPAALMLLAIGLTMQRRYALAWIALALAVLVKPLPVVIAPLLFAAQLQDEGLSPGLAIGPLCAIVVAYLTALPFAPSAAPLALFHWLGSIMLSGSSLYVVTSENAYNLWTLVAQPVADTRTFLGISYHAWGWLAFFAMAIPAYWVFLRKDETNRSQMLVVAAFIVLAALFLLTTRMHERYVLPALALTPVMWQFGRAARIAVAVLTVTFVLGVGVQEFSGHVPPSIQEAAIHALSLVNLACIIPLVFSFLTAKRDNRESIATA